MLIIKIWPQKNLFSLLLRQAIQGVKNASATQTVVDRLPAFVAFQNPRLFKNGQMLAYGGEFHTDGFHKFADAVFLTICKLFDNPKPGRMAQCFKYFRLPAAAVFIEFLHFFSDYVI